MITTEIVNAILDTCSDARVFVNLSSGFKRMLGTGNVSLRDVKVDVRKVLSLLLAKPVLLKTLFAIIKFTAKTGSAAVLVALLWKLFWQVVSMQLYRRGLAVARADNEARIADYAEGRITHAHVADIPLAVESMDIYQARRAAMVVHRTLLDYQDRFLEFFRDCPGDMEDFSVMSLPTLGDYRSLDPGAFRLLLLRLLHGYQTKNKITGDLVAVQRAQIFQFTGDIFVPITNVFSPQLAVSSGCRVWVSQVSVRFLRWGGTWAQQLFAARIRHIAGGEAV